MILNVSSMTDLKRSFGLVELHNLLALLVATCSRHVVCEAARAADRMEPARGPSAPGCCNASYFYYWSSKRGTAVVLESLRFAVNTCLSDSAAIKF